jgi:hypothetical protein
MKRFISIASHDLPDSFDRAVHGDAPVLDIDETSDRITITFRLPGFVLSSTSAHLEGRRREFDKVDVSSAGFLAESGRPLLPSFGRYVQLPPNVDFTLAKISLGNAEETNDIVVFPAQNALTDDPDASVDFQFDERLYESDETYPPNLVSLSGPFVFDGYTAALLHIRPLQYNPAKRTLTAYGRITIELEVKPKEKLEDTDAYCDPDLNREAYGNLLLNPRRWDERRLGSPPFADAPSRSWPSPWLRPVGPELLIIYHESFEAAAEKLAQWKSMRGLITDTVRLGDDNMGRTPGTIKKYIRSRRRKRFARLRYVILLGDVEHIPSEDIDRGSPWGSNRTDHYYFTPSDLTSDTDTVLPWIAGGRIPVQTQDEADSVVEQIIRYEKDPPVDSAYYRRLAVAALFQDADSYGNFDNQESRAYMMTMEGIREHMVSLGFDVERIYVSDTESPEFYNDGSAVPDAVKGAIVDNVIATSMVVAAANQGQLIVAHRDHGMQTGWHLPAFTSADVRTLTNRVPSVFLSVNCQTGWFDRNGGADSFAESILKFDGASPSLIAATRNSHSFLNDSLMKAIFDGLWGGMIATFPDTTSSYPVKRGRLGDLLNYAKTYLPVKHAGQDIYIRDHFEIYHVIGDPTLEIWTSAPRALSVSAAVNLSRRTLNIQVNPVPRGAVLTLWHGDRMLKRIEPESENISVPIRELMIETPGPTAGSRPLARDVYQVCYAAPGHRFASIGVKLR